MSKKNAKFSDIWVNQTTLGKQFGLSAIAMGKKLKQLGLRSNATGSPTQEAIDNGFCNPHSAPSTVTHQQKGDVTVQMN